MADNIGKDIGHFFGIPADVEEPAGLESTWSYQGTPDYRAYSGEMDTASAQYYSDLQRALAARQAQEGLVNQLQESAAGRGESAAQLMYEQRRQQALQDQASMASSARGMRSATSQRALTEQAAESQRKAILESAMLRLQEQRSAQQALAGVAQQMRGQDYSGAGLAGQMYGTQASALGAQNQNRLGVEELKQKDAAQRAAAAMERYRLAVAQEAARAKAWGELGQNLLTGGSQAGALGQNMLKNVKPRGDDEPMNIKEGGGTTSEKEDAAGGEAETEGEFEDFGFDGEPTGGDYSTEEDNVGGEAETSEPYAQGGFVQGLSNFAPGGVVKGRARVRGNSSQNDTQPALMQPGQVVLPRTVAQSPNAPQKAKSFVEHLKCGGKVQGFAKGGEAISDVSDDYTLDRLYPGVSVEYNPGPSPKLGWDGTGVSQRDRDDFLRWKQAWEASPQKAGSIEHRNYLAAQERFMRLQDAAAWKQLQERSRAAAMASGEGQDMDAVMARMNAVGERKKTLAKAQRQFDLDVRRGAYGGPGINDYTGKSYQSKYAPEEYGTHKYRLQHATQSLAGEEEGTRAALEAAKERDAQRAKDRAKAEMAASRARADQLRDQHIQQMSKFLGITPPSQVRMDTSDVPSAQLDEATQAKIKAQNEYNQRGGPAPDTTNRQQALLNAAEKKREEPQPMADGGEVDPYAQVTTGLGDENVPAPNGLPGMLTQTSTAQTPVADDAANASRALALGDGNVLAAQSSLRGALGLADGGEVDPSTGLPPAEMDTYQRPMSSGEATIANRARMEKEDEMDAITSRPQLAPLKPVNAVLSPGEIVVDRGTAKDPEKVKQFVAAIKKDDSPPEFAGVLAARSRAEQAAKQAAPAEQQQSPEAKEFVERMASPDGQSVYDPRQDEVDAYIAKLQAAQNASQATEAAREMAHSTMDRGEKPRRNFMQALAAKYGYDTSFTAGMPTLHPRERNKQ